MLTNSRPLGSHELYWARTRGPGGRNDIYAIAVFNSPESHSIKDDDVINAWALVRMHHPVLAARIFTQPKAELVCTLPATWSQAFEEARLATSFRTFTDRDVEESAVLDLVQNIDVKVAMDMSMTTSRIFFSRGVDAATGQFVLAVEFVHSVADGRSEMKVLQQMIELLAHPARALEELKSRFDLPPQPPKLPECLDNLMPELSSYDPDELEKGKAAYDQLTKAGFGMGLSGLESDRIPRDDPTPRILIHVWSSAETERILSSCKRRGFSITPVIAAAMAIAALRERKIPSSMRNGEDSDPDAPPHLFAVNTAVDLSGRLQPSMRSDDIATRVRSFAVFLQLSQAPRTNEEQARVLWELAAQYKEYSSAFIGTPYLWQFLQYSRPFAMQAYKDRLSGKPHLPYLSSLGNLTPIFPAHYHINGRNPAHHADSSQAGKDLPEIEVVNMHIGGKMPEGAVHIWSYNGKLHAQLTYSYETYWSPALMNSYLRRIVDMVTEAGELDVERTVQEIVSGAQQNRVTLVRQ